MGEGEGGRGPARRPMACEYTGEKAVLRLGKEEVPLAEAGRCEVLRVGGPVANEALAELLAPLADLTELVLKRIRHLPRLGHMTRLGRVTVSDSPALTFAESVFAGLGSLTEILVNNTGLAHLPRSRHHLDGDHQLHVCLHGGAYGSTAPRFLGAHAG